MNFKKTLILALMLASLCSYIFFVENPLERMQERKDYVFKNFSGSTTDSVEILKGGQSFILENTVPKKSDPKEQDSATDLAASAGSINPENFKNWQLAELKGSKLDSGNLYALLSSLADLKIDEVIPAENLDADLASYGLKNPAIVLKVKSSGVSREIQIGAYNPYLKKRYFRLAESPQVYLTSDSIFTALNKSKEDFRDHLSLHYLDSELKSIGITRDIAGKQEQLKFVLDGANKWQIVEPIKGLASTEAIAEFNRNLRNMRVKDFINDTAKQTELKLDHPMVKVNLEFKDAAKQPIEIAFSQISKNEGDKKTDYFYQYLSGAPSINSLTLDPFQALLKPLDQFREKLLFTLPTQLVKKVTVEEDNHNKMIVEKDGANWLVNKQAGDKAFIDQWIANLSQVQAFSFPNEDKDFGFSKPRLKFTVEIVGSGKDNKPTEKVLLIGSAIADKDGLRYYASVDDLKTIFVIKQDVFKKIALSEESLIPQIGSQAETPIESEVAAPE